MSEVRCKIDRARSTTLRPSVLELAAAPPSDDDDDDTPLFDLKAKRSAKNAIIATAVAKSKSRKPPAAKKPPLVKKKTASRTTTKTKNTSNATKDAKEKKKPPAKRDEDEHSFDSANDQISGDDDDDDELEADAGISDEDYAYSGTSESEEEADVGNSAPQGKYQRAAERTTAAKRSGATRTNARAAKKSSSEDDDDFSFGSPPTKPRAARVTKKSGTSNSRDDEEDDLLDSSSDEEAALRSRRALTTSQANSPRRRLSLYDSSDEESLGNGEHETPRTSPSTPTRRGTPSRASAVRASRRLAEAASASDDADEAFPKKRRAKKKDSDDDDFILEGDEASDDNLLQESEAESEDAVIVKSGGRDDLSSEGEAKVVGIVKEGEIGDADDDDDSCDGEPAYHSPQLELKSRGRSAADVFGDDDDDDDSSADKSPACPHCPSTEDVVTGEELSETHVCFFPPDGQSRQCFSLETLRKIALTTSHPRFRTDLMAGGGNKQTFLQPPHFRTEMSDDLLDQIASRFGRDALDLHGDYYNRKAAARVAGDLWPERETETAGMALEHSENIIEHLERYMRSRMGHQDVYCCPLCYIVAHKQLLGEIKGEDSDDAEEEDARKERYPTEFSYDPMTVLGFLDNDGFRIASTFCFKKVTVLKEHLRRDHGVDPKMVDGNEAYNRYKIRGQDGLLQRYLSKCAGKWGTSRQGEMLSYWYQGNNCSFLLLLSLMSHAALCRDTVKAAVDQSDEEAVERAVEYLQPASDFFDSFADEARAIWDTIASPFSKASKEEIRDFLADDDVMEEPDPASSHRALHMQAELEEFRNEQEADQQLAADYERLEKEGKEDLEDEEVDDDDDEAKEEDSAGGDGDNDAESDEEAEQAEFGYGQSEDDVANGGYFDESEEEEDDWQKSILNKRIAKRKSPKRSGRRVSMSEVKASPKKRAARGSPAPSDDDDDILVPPTSVVRKRLAIQDSDDED